MCKEKVLVTKVCSQNRKAILQYSVEKTVQIQCTLITSSVGLTEMNTIENLRSGKSRQHLA